MVKISTEEQKRVKRERERERRRIIREDPIKKEQQRQKEHQKYLKQKEKKIRKSVNDMTPREQRKKRKEWRKYTKNHRLGKKLEHELLEENTPPPSDNENNDPDPELREDRRRQIANRNKIKRYREKKKLEQQNNTIVAELTKRMQMYKKRLYRLKKQMETNKLNSTRPVLTPITRVNQGTGYKTDSFCTLSEALEHNPAAIWAHLCPILEFYSDKGIESLHFLSDSPSTQYRNKTMFAFIANHIQTYFKCAEITWNYTGSWSWEGSSRRNRRCL